MVPWDVGRRDRAPRRKKRARSRATSGRVADVVPEQDDSAGRVVGDVGGDSLASGRGERRVERSSIVEVAGERAEVRRLAAVDRRKVEAIAVAAQARELLDQRQVRALEVRTERVRIGGW